MKISYRQKHFFVAADHSMDSLKDFRISFLINENTVAVSRVIHQGHEHLKDSHSSV